MISEKSPTESVDCQVEQHQTHCCEVKAKLMPGNGFIENLIIKPKYIIFNKSPKGIQHKEIIEIRNQFDSARKFEAKHSLPKIIRAKNLPENLLLHPSIPHKIELLYGPTQRHPTSDNQRFSIYLSSTHPNCTIEIPIFIILGPPSHDIAIPKWIQMHSTAPKLSSFYNLLIYNPFKDDVAFTIKKLERPNQTLNISKQCGTIKKRGSFKITLEAISNDNCPFESDLFLHFNEMKIKIKVLVESLIKNYNLYLNRNIIQFDDVYLGLRTESYLRVCNESHEIIKYKWCRREKKPFEFYECLKTTDDELFVKTIDKVFQIIPKFGKIEPFSSKTFLLVFLPPKELEEKTENPRHLFESKAYLSFSSDHSKRTEIVVKGVAIGARIDFIKKEIILKDTYVGELKTIQAVVENTGPIRGKILYESFDSVIIAYCKVEPLEIILEPKEKSIFTIQYFTATTGEFLDKITFKIEYSDQRTLFFKGNSIPVQLNVCPNLIEFGRIPVCFVQKKYLLIANPLSVPIVIKCHIDCDGIEIPLILDIPNEEEDIVPNFSKDKQSMEKANIPELEHFFSNWIREACKNELSQIQANCSDLKRVNTSVETLKSFAIEAPCSPTETIESSCSDFSTTILELEDDLPEIARILIKNVKNPNIVQYREADLNALHQIFNILKNKSDFQQLTELDNIVDRTWELKNKPKEFIIDHHSIYLKPFESVEILVALTPNLVGSFEKILEVRTTPINRLTEIDFNYENESTINIDPRYLTTKIPIYYKSMIPKLEIKPEIEFNSYVEKKEFFDIMVNNITNIDGFAEFKIFSNELKVYFAPRKFYIGPKENKLIKILFIPVIPGKLNIIGNLCILACDSPIPFTIKCKAAPPKVLIKPIKIIATQKVTTLKQHTIFIENICPTKARFFVDLKTEMDCLEIDPLGGILGPGQCVAIVISAYFTDPGTYLNTLQIFLTHFGAIDVPLTFNVHGIPVTMSATSLDLGYAFISDKIYQRELEFINYGRKEYKLGFQKIKTKSEDLNMPEFTVIPKSVILQPKGKRTTVIFSIQSSVPAKVLENFVVSGVYDLRKRFQFDILPVSIIFFKSKLTWSKNKLTFLSQHTTFPPNETINQKVLLTNCAPIRAQVYFHVTGNFKVVVDNQSLRQEIIDGEFSIEPSEAKEIGVLVNNNVIETNRTETYLTGKIYAKCEGIKQKTLELEAILTYPTIEVCSPEQYFLSSGNKFFAKFFIKNQGTLEAYYKWKIVQECLTFQNDSDLNIQYLNNQILNFSEIIQSNSCVFYLTHLIDIDQEYEKYLEILMNKDEDSDLLIINPDQNPAIPTVRLSTGRRLSKSQSKSQKSLIQRMSKILPIEIKSTQEIIEEESLQLPDSEFDDVCDEIKNFIKYKKVKNQAVNQEIYNKIDDYEFVDDDDDDDCSIKNKEIEDCNCKKLNAILLDNYDDKLQPNENRAVGVFFNRDSFDNRITKRTYYYSYELQIGGGESQTLSLVVFDFNSKIVIPMSLYDFGKQPWYKKLNVRINLFNSNLFNCKIRTIDSQLSSFVYGYVKSKCHKCFILGENVCCATFVQVFLGFSSYFNETFGIEVNKLVPIPISFQGCGLIPQLRLINISRPTFHLIDPNISYPTLEYMYQNEILNTEIIPTKPKKTEMKLLTEYLNQFNIEEEQSINLRASKLSSHKSKESKLAKEKKTEKDSSKDKNPPGIVCKGPGSRGKEEPIIEEAASIEELEEEEEACTEDETEEQDILNVCPFTGKYFYGPKQKTQFRANVIEKVDNDICDFEVLDYPNEYPTALDIEQQIEKTVFLRNLERYEQYAQSFTKIIEKCVIPKPESKEIYYKTFIIRPLPHYTTEYFVDFHHIMLNEFNYYELDLIYYGPGNLIMAARTDIIIPDFKVKLFCSKIFSEAEYGSPNETDPNFSPYHTEHKTTEKYENLTERNRGSDFDIGNCDKCKKCVGFCAECRIKLCHPHSYDVDLNYQHQRVYDKNLRKKINDYYSKLNQGYKETKPNYVLSEIYQRNVIDIDVIKFKIKIEYTPNDSQYDLNQEFEDYLFIDIHLGPTIPILMKGVFKMAVTNACKVENDEYDPECEEVELPVHDTRTL